MEISHTTQDTPFSDDRMATCYKALGHPARLAIIRHLLTHDGCICGHIVNAIPLAQSTASQHLRILKIAKLIHGQSNNPTTGYSVTRETLDQLPLFLKNMLIHTDRRSP